MRHGARFLPPILVAPLQLERWRRRALAPILGGTLLAVAAALLAALAAARPVAATAGDKDVRAAETAAFREFERRAGEYAKLSRRLERSLSSQHKQTDVPGKIEAREQTLASRIRAERADARPGALFAPDVAAEIRRIVGAELKTPLGASEKKEIRDEGTAAVVPEVNAEYPPAAPLSTVPPPLLLRLPRLPAGLEYRFAGRHLILRDVKANLIVDYIENCVPKG